MNTTLINKYGWETVVDTSTTWRIGDGTAGLYNYIFIRLQDLQNMILLEAIR